MVYCRKETEAHPISIRFPRSLIGINAMITKEGQRCNLFDENWKVLDMDDIETNLARQYRRSKTSTTDFAMGIKISNSSKMLLVECKFGCGNEGVKGLTEGELTAKVNGTIGILGQEPPIHFDVYFLFSNNEIKQARNKMVRFSTGKKKYHAKTTTEFRDCFNLICSSECRNNGCQYYPTQTA
jgi:hypothetical protein